MVSGNSNPFDWWMDIIFNRFCGNVSNRFSSSFTFPDAIGMNIFHSASLIDSNSLSSLEKSIFAEYLLKNPF